MTEFPGFESGEPSWAARPHGSALPYSYPPGAYPPLEYPAFPPAAAGSGNGLGIASLVVGSVALVTSPLCIGFVLGIAATAMGLAARRRFKRGQATEGGPALGGVVLGILATLIGLAVGAILCAIFVVGIATDQFNSDYQHCLLENNGIAQNCEQYR